MKSKDDLTRQIQRIYKKHGEHRLYKKALQLTMSYNYNMSETKTNAELHRKYMTCHNEDERQRILMAMNETKYTRKEYANF